MIKRFILSALALTAFQFANAQHDHIHDHGKNPVPDYLLIGFDEKAAMETIKEKHIPASETEGYMRYLKNNYVAKTHPEYKWGQPTPIKKKDGGPVIQGNPNCDNLSFENVDFSNWVGKTGTGPQAPNWVGGIMNVQNAPPTDPNSRQTILTTAPGNNNPANGPVVGYDPIAINPITGLADIPYLSPTGGGVSVRLGNANTGAEVENLTFSLPVTNANTGFTYQYAIVLENPSGHPVNAQPYLRITVKDQNGNVAGGVCGVYQIDGLTAASDSSFISINGGAVMYKKWTTVGVDLTAYIGTTVTVEFQTGDCDYGGHYGYTYIDASCAPLTATVGYCPGDTIAALVGTPGYATYQWIDPQGNNIPAPQGTNDTLLITNANIGDVFSVVLTSTAGCQTTISITIVYSVTAIQGLSVTPSCTGGASGSATVYPVGGGQGGYTYLWTPGNQTTQTATNLAPGTYNLHVASGSCGSVDTTVVIGIAPPTLVQQQYSFCGAMAKIPAPLNMVNYKWYDNNGNAIPGAVGSNDTLYRLNPAVNDVYCCTYFTQQGCKDSLRVTIVPSNSVQLFLNTLTDACFGGNNGAADVFAFGGNMPYNFDWVGPNGFHQVQNGVNNNISGLTGLSGGNYTVTVMSSDSCVAQTFFTVNVTPPVTTTAMDSICVGDTITLNAPAGFSGHQWYNINGVKINGATSGFFVATSGLTGTYIDTMRTAGSGCIQVFRYTLFPGNLQTSTIKINNPCYGDNSGSIDLTAWGGYKPKTYHWVGPNFQSNSEDISGLYAGLYVVTSKSGGCTQVDSVVITEPPAPADTLSITTLFCDGDSATVLHGPKGWGGYQWSLNGVPVIGETSDSIFVTDLSNFDKYTVSYFVNGCRKRTSVVERTIPPGLFHPDNITNIFTPNGDGKNDLFFPYNRALVTQKQIQYYTDVFTVTVFNRWGEKVFDSSTYDGWDGTNRNGKDCDDGIYYWMSTYRPRCSVDGQVYEYKGFVHLVRSR